MPFKFRSAGMLAYIGKYEGLSDLPDFKIKGKSTSQVAGDMGLDV